MRVRIAIFCGAGAAMRSNEGAGDYAARVAMVRGDADGAFELLDALLAAGGAERLGPPPVSAAANGHAPLNGNGLPAVNGNEPAGNGAAPRSRVPALSSRESAE